MGPCLGHSFLCISAGSTEGPDTLGRTVQWGASPSSIPMRTNTYSKLPESAVTPRSPPRGCAEPGPGGKALIHALGRGPDPGPRPGVWSPGWGQSCSRCLCFSNRHLPRWLLLESVSNLRHFTVKGKFLWVKFCLANLKLNLPLLVFLS